MVRLDIPQPRGLSESSSFSEQPPRYSRDEQNVRTIDNLGRARYGPRSGSKRFGGDNASVSAGNPVRFMKAIAYPVPDQTYASLGDALTTERRIANTVSGDTLGVVTGSQGDIYAIDGATGILKVNADAATVWKIALPASDSGHIVRALWVDAGTPGQFGTDLVFAGVSTGGSSLTAKMWAYVQKDDAKTEKLWELSPGGYVEGFRVRDNVLYVLVNYPDKNSAEVQVYSDYLTNTPTLDRHWAVPYPAHEMAVSPFDGTIFTASDANTRRDINPDSPKGTRASVDMGLDEIIPNKERIWAWFDASDTDTLSIVPRKSGAAPGSTDELDGGNVLMWLDKSGHGRNFYQTPASVASGSGVATRGGIFRAKGINGLPSVHFDGSTTGLISETAATVDKADRGDSQQVIPGYRGAQFVVCMVIRAAVDWNRRGLLGIGTLTGGAGNMRAVTVGYSSTLGTGANLAPGHIRLMEEGGGASDAAASSPAAAGVLATDSKPAGAGVPDSGFCVVTWVCDGGIHDVFGTATRSTFRVNGVPCERWQSAAYSTIEATTLGYIAGATAQGPGFVGEVAEMVVLSDWYDTQDVVQRLIGGTPTSSYGYPDGNFATGSDTELERLEGRLAHKWGIAHELSGGRASYLTFTGNAAAGETVTVGSVTYTWRAAPALANEVRVGSAASGAATDDNSAVYLYRAVNRIGTPGFDYGNATVANPNFRASAPFLTAANTWAMLFRSRGSYDAAGATTETMGAASFNAATSSTSINGSGGPTGWYPHPFFIDKTTNTAGGPPRAAGASTISNFWRLRSIYPILAAWDPANGKPKDVLTSNYDALGIGVGGVGYAVTIASTGEIYSAGPRQAVVATAPAILVDAVDIRKVGWSQQQFVTAGGGVGDPWALGSLSTPASPGALGYAYLRMAVDKYDNLYVPYFNTTGGNNVSLLAFKKASTGTALYNPVALFTYSGLTDFNEAHAVAVDPTYPTIPAASTVTQAEFLVLATRIEAIPTTKASIFRLKAVSTTNLGTSSRAVIGVAVANGDVKSFTSTAMTLIASAGLDSAARYIDGAVLLGKLYLSDGKQYKVFDPVANTFGVFTSTVSGKIPPRCSIVSTHRMRLVLAGCKDNVAAWFMSKQGSPGDFDMHPYTITAIQAANGVESRAGGSPDKITAWINYSDDLSIIGCDSSIWRLTGDPTPTGGGELHCISNGLGIAWGRAWCIDPHGTLYFFGSRGGLWRMGIGGAPEPVSSTRDAASGLWSSRIEDRLRTINLNTYRIELQWNHDDIGVHIFVCTQGIGGTVVESYFWCAETDSWHPDKRLRSSMQPSCSCSFDGDDPDDRAVLIGCEDGRIRRLDEDSTGDDTIPSTGVSAVAFDSFVILGPLAGSERGREALFSQLECLVANDQGGPWAKLYVTDRPDVLGDPVWQGALLPGRSPRFNVKKRGAFVYLELRMFDPRARWALEHVAFNDVRDAGLCRSVTA